jgi:hypothetical protein
MIPVRNTWRERSMNQDREIDVYRRRGHPQYCATFAPSSLAANGWSFVETVDEQLFHPDTVRVIERDVVAYGEPR